MAQHRRQGIKNTRRIASTAALAATAAVVAPGVAQAAEVVVPNTDYRFEVAGLETVPNIDQVPNIDRYVPSLGQVSDQQNTTYAPAGHKQAAPAQQTVGQKKKPIPRTSQAQASAGTPVPLDQLQPGDIIAYYGGASHVGIYTGHGTIIDALNSGVPVQERDMNYMPIHSAVRF